MARKLRVEYPGAIYHVVTSTCRRELTPMRSRAWQDGPPYAYHYGLTKARKHLQELGALESQLPPFDESKFELMPDVELNPKDEFWVDPGKLDSQN